jgi:hypothetical protein
MELRLGAGLFPLTLHNRGYASFADLKNSQHTSTRNEDCFVAQQFLPPSRAIPSSRRLVYCTIAFDQSDVCRVLNADVILGAIDSSTRVNCHSSNPRSVCGSTALLPPVAGKNFHPQTWTIRRWPDDLQLNPDQPVPHLPTAVSASLSRWLKGEGHPRRDALRPRLRTSPGGPLSP